MNIQPTWTHVARASNLPAKAAKYPILTNDRQGLPCPDVLQRTPAAGACCLAEGIATQLAHAENTEN